MANNKRSPRGRGKDGATRQRELNQRKRDQGLVPLTVWIPAERKQEIIDIIEIILRDEK